MKSRSFMRFKEKSEALDTPAKFNLKKTLKTVAKIGVVGVTAYAMYKALELFIQTLLDSARLEFNRPEKGIMGKFGVLRHHGVISQNDCNTFKQNIKSIRNPVFHSSGFKVDREELLSFYRTVENFVKQYSKYITNVEINTQPIPYEPN